MSDFSRREFLKRSVASTVAGGVALTGFGKTAAAASTLQVGTVIDLTRCDGCRTLAQPACVTACREENKKLFPDPIKDIGNYWPQKKKEDWSDKKGLTSRLTPYNWTFVQKVQVEHGGRRHIVNIPRRCMHCDNPPCADLCPFSVLHKMPNGPVLIDHDLCFGGAKCRDVCPWGIPARQAGVGIYLHIAPKFAGGGVMYKCNLCYDRLKSGRKPACVEACPQEAILFGEKDKMRELAHRRAEEIDGYIYGEKENGGTSTFYVSPVPFEKIHAELTRQKAAQPNPKAPGFPGMSVDVENLTDTANGIALSMVIAPVAGIAAAAGVAYKTMKGGRKDG
ncbi:MAG TPA: 4Fe-4S dicluster domain-containing protein [Syntrophales bacterium]|nr:4Fe-4S dicluster domain-containing protein [Syntrophales bacterium]HPQ43361.1 4Fe-4S dicluster domain-containing protein [Syntrophales bacterium]